MADYKVVQVTFTRGVDGLQYPDRYNAQEVEANGKGPAVSGYSGEMSQGADAGHCLIVLESTLADEYAVDPDMEIVSPARADALVDKWRKSQNLPSEIVTNPDRIMAIRAKQSAGMPLTQEDRDVLDPDKDIGIQRANKPLREKLPLMNLLDA